MSMNGVQFVIKSSDGKEVEIQGGVDWVTVPSEETVESGFDFSKEISVPCTFREPQNIKDLQEMGFTERQAWNIHLRKGESWKQN